MNDFITCIFINKCYVLKLSGTELTTNIADTTTCNYTLFF